jgi:Domain of unknown function (DUF4331)
MNTKLYLAFLATSLLSVAALQGCGSDSNGTGGSGSTTGSDATSTATSTGGGSNFPAAPKLGTQIDRFGRPAINAALNHVFDADLAAQGKAKDAYNQGSDPLKWTDNVKEFAANLAILDSLDANCGNQLLAGKPLDATRYVTLAGALADDRVYLDTSAAACTTYLAVEANATKQAPNTDCGGRKLDYDVIDASYSVLAAGSIVVIAGDGVAADADTKGTEFPYLAAPH